MQQPISVERNHECETVTLQAGRVALTLEAPGDVASLSGISRDFLRPADLLALAALLSHPAAQAWLAEATAQPVPAAD